VYANADIYLLDDPLSAVDADVGRHIFENCILGLLHEKAVCLVTHQLQFLHSATQILVLDTNGRQEFRGTWESLSTRQGSSVQGQDSLQLLHRVAEPQVLDKSKEQLRLASSKKYK